MRGAIAQELLAQGTPAAWITVAQGLPSQGALAMEMRQAKLLEQQQHLEQEVSSRGAGTAAKEAEKWQWWSPRAQRCTQAIKNTKITKIAIFDKISHF